MKLLILTQYYPPEIGAPQNRLHELAVLMKSQNLDVEVLTAMPNYPSMKIHAGYEDGKIKEEVIDGIKVYRAPIFVTESKGIIKRLLNYFSFVFTSMLRGRKLGQYDYLMVESPPLFLGYSAMFLARKLKAKLIFNVSDLWPESAEKMELVNNKQLLNLAYNLEAKCYKKSWLVTGQTEGIIQSINERFPKVKTHWLPNGVNLDFYNPAQIEAKDFRSKNGFSQEDVIFFYGGIIGHAQGLQTLLYAAELLKNEKSVQLVLQGSGPVKDELLELKTSLNLSNVHFLDPVPKESMPSILKEVDVAVVPLRKLALFEGAIPSKIFEAQAMEIPLLLGVSGEAKRHFVEKAGAALFCEPENHQILAENMLKLAKDKELRIEMGKKGRTYVLQYFNRTNIARQFLNQLKNN